MADAPLDNAAIDLIAREVLSGLKKARAEGSSSSPAAALPPHAHSQPRSATLLDASLQLLSVTGGVVGQPCVIEPDKPCVGSLKCRSFGH